MTFTFTGETMKFRGRTLHRVFYPSLNEVGGWIESALNLSEDGDNGVFGEAKVLNGGKLFNNVQLYDDAVCDGAVLTQNCRMSDQTEAFGRRGKEVLLIGGVQVLGQTKIVGPCRVSGDGFLDDGKKHQNEDVRVYGFDVLIDPLVLPKQQ